MNKPILALLLFAVACGSNAAPQGDGGTPDAGGTPDSGVPPDNRTPNELLLDAQTALANAVGGDVARYASIYTQHVQGLSGNYLAAHEYNLQSSAVDALWNTLYGVISDVRKLRQDADANEYFYFSGIARVLEAYTLLLLTDLWGDVPYTDAFSSTEPSFDAQLFVYNDVLSLLNGAILAFGASPGALIPTPESDLIYGDAGTLETQIARWNAMAHVLAARAYLHLSPTNASYYSRALTEISAGGFSSLQGDAAFDYSRSSADNPWFVINSQPGALDVESFYSNLMQSLNDPRAPRYGVTLDDAHPYLTATRPLILVGYTEQKFIEAECRMRSEGATAATHQAYLDAIAASFDYLGLSINYAAYVGQAAVDPGQANLTMNEIMTQKYIALFVSPELFTDWRRTGIPSLTPNTGTEIPRRLPYPQVVAQNPNTPTVSVFDPVWWDE